MTEWRLFPEGTIPEWATPEWYADRDVAPHLEQDGHRDRLLLTADMVADAISRGGDDLADVVDLGAGDGGLLSILTGPGQRWGYDLQPTNVAAAEARGEMVELADVVAEWPRTYQDEADVVVATEFLEHLVDPHDMVRRIAATRARYLIASSPYTETDQSHYEFHLWAFDEEGYRALLENNGWRVLRQERSWIAQVVLAERADG